MERLSKRLANSSIASRRKSEELILAGRIKVNGVVVTDLATLVSKKDLVLVDDEVITRAANVYFLLNKPTGYLSTTSDEKGRKTVLDLIKPEDKTTRIYPIGRLDSDSAGLIILTNDGVLTERLSHPRYEIEKEYLVRVKGIVIRKKIQSIRKNGVKISDSDIASVKAISIEELDKKKVTTLLRITLTEGKNREIRKMMEKIGHEVLKLTRIRYAFLTTDINRGDYRSLKPHEVKRLYQNYFS